MSQEQSDIYNDRLNKWVNLVTEMEKQISDLKDENKRLRKAGDAMAESVVPFEPIPEEDKHIWAWELKLIADWLAAKGVQS